MVLKDSEALYQAMEQMMVDKEKAVRYATHARPIIEARFEQGFVRQCLYDFYEEITQK